MISSITFKLTEIWIKSFSKVKVIGPLEFNSFEFHEMIEFRTHQNLARAPHLEKPFQTSIEENLQIDERSLHFAIRKENKIVACVRLTPAPFELSALSSELTLQGNGFHGYYEFSRLCTDVNLERKGFHAGILVVKAALHIFQKLRAKGIVGICRTEKTEYMKKLGLKADQPAIWIPQRMNAYQLVHATQQELILFYFKRFARMLINTENKEGTIHESRIAEKTT